MKGLLGTVVLVVVFPVAAGAEGPCAPGEAPKIGADGSIICVKTAVTPEAPKKARGGGSAGQGSELPTHRPLWTPFLSTQSGPDGAAERCIDSSYDYSLGRDPTPSEDIEMERRFFLYLRAGIPICRGAEVPSGSTPALEAANLYRRIPLPPPSPYIHPGRLPVGFDAYLETGADPTSTYGPEPTPFGDLYLHMDAEIYVNWDDPHDGIDGEEGPYEGNPGRYPDGEITHLYQHEGHYEIAVRYVWTASWELGDDSGTLTGIETSGIYPAPGFEVYSRQAVG